MSEHQPEPDPRATFQQDQEDAQAETETREAATWRLHVEHAEADNRLTNAVAARHLAMANLWVTVSGALWSLVLMAAVILAWVSVGAVVDLLQ